VRALYSEQSCQYRVHVKRGHKVDQSTATLYHIASCYLALLCLHFTVTGELIATDPQRVPCLACPPTHDGAWCGSADTTAAVAHEGARTVPPREHGGNCDIKNLSRGSKIYFPVYVPGITQVIAHIHATPAMAMITSIVELLVALLVIVAVPVLLCLCCYSREVHGTCFVESIHSLLTVVSSLHAAAAIQSAAV
jgi:Acetamidase/Formamidase family